MIKQLAFALCMVLGSTAHAAFEVTVAYTDSVALLQKQVWRGDENLALDSASLGSEAGLGYPSLEGAGTPLFAFAAGGLKVNWAGGFSLGTWLVVKRDRPVYYAEATAIPSVNPPSVNPPSAVPLPAAGYLFLSALLGLSGRKWFARR